MFAWGPDSGLSIKTPSHFQAIGSSLQVGYYWSSKDAVLWCFDYDLQLSESSGDEDIAHLDGYASYAKVLPRDVVMETLLMMETMFSPYWRSH